MILMEYVSYVTARQNSEEKLVHTVMEQENGTNSQKHISRLISASVYSGTGNFVQFAKRSIIMILTISKVYHRLRIWRNYYINETKSNRRRGRSDYSMKVSSDRIEMASKYDGYCKECRDPYEEGDKIFWKSGEGVLCDVCGEADKIRKKIPHTVLHTTTATTQNSDDDNKITVPKEWLDMMKKKMSILKKRYSSKYNDDTITTMSNMIDDILGEIQ